ncbi:MAG: hypothetical protein H7249_04390 [Chitinophagaceae bacterium]|nr:hypothetical protein [Oligoflexus sp.]
MKVCFRLVALSIGLVFMMSSPCLFAAEARGTNSKETIEHGLETVKDGTIEAGKSVSAAAEEVGKNAAEVTKKVGRTIKAVTCPVVGDRKTKLYYAADSKSYQVVLDGQKYFEDDDRSCFRTEDAARAEGYTRSAN